MKKHILVTGAHRSGSTWVGRVVSQSSKVRYVQEPFNLVIEKYKHPFKNQFECLTGQDPKQQRIVKYFVKGFYKNLHKRSLTKLLAVRSIKDLRKFLSDQKARLTQRSLLKDPLALCSADWLHTEFDYKTVVLIRHPAAFVASLKVKDIQFQLLFKSALVNGTEF